MSQKNAIKQLAISTGQEWEMLSRNNKALDCLFQGPQFASSKLVMDLNNGDHGGEGVIVALGSMRLMVISAISLFSNAQPSCKCRPGREKTWRTSNILSLVNFRLMLTDYVLKFKGCYREAWWDDTRGSGLKVLGFLSRARDVGLRFDERIYASFVCIMFPPTE